MQAVIESSKAFVAENKEYTLVDLGYGIQVTKTELMGTIRNRDECEKCESRNSFIVWDTECDEWIHLCRACCQKRIPTADA